MRADVRKVTMQRRILQENGLFYPQYKGWFMWHYFYVHDAGIDGMEHRYPESFAAIEAAMSFLFPEQPKVVWQSSEQKA
jgi:hypothetical protein